MPIASETERWHLLLNSRYVCDICLTRFFIRHRRCPACHRFSSIHPLNPKLSRIARSEEQLRSMMAQSQTSKPPQIVPPHHPETR